MPTSLNVYYLYTVCEPFKFCNYFEKKRLQGNGQDGQRKMTVGDASRLVGESIKSKELKIVLVLDLGFISRSLHSGHAKII